MCLPIQNLRQQGEKLGWDDRTQIIVVCEFISHLNMGTEFGKYLEGREEEENEMDSGGD